MSTQRGIARSGLNWLASTGTVAALALASVGIVGVAQGQVSDNFDSTPIGSLPSGWTTSGTGAGAPWAVASDFSNSAPNAVKTNDVATVSSRFLELPIVNAAGSVTLSFWRRFQTEATFDGFTVEASVNGSPFANIGTAAFTLNGYNQAAISVNFMSPIAGQPAFSGAGLTWTQSTAVIPANVGDLVAIRFHMASDTSVASTGVWIDDVVVNGGVTGPGACCANDGTCTVSTACAAPALFLGVGSTCSGAGGGCPSAAGACCSATTGNCAYVLGAAACTAGNTYSGNGSVCSPNSCPPVGSCCVSSAGTCSVTTAAACAGNLFSGPGTTCVSNPCPPPANDECPNAIAIAPGAVPVGNSTATTGADNNAPACPTAAAAINNDVWYKWTATSSGQIVISTRSYSPAAFAGRYAIYDGGAAPGVCPVAGAGLIACNAFTANAITAPAPTAMVTAGNVYYIQLGSQAVGVSGSALLDFEFQPDTTGSCCVGASCSVRTAGECAAVSGSFVSGALCSAATANISSYSGGGGTIVDPVAPNEGIATSAIVVTDTFPIAGVEVDINTFAHSFAGDLIITLDNGSRTVFLNNRARRAAAVFGSGGADFLGANTYTWSDTGTTTIFDLLLPTTLTTVPSGIYKSGGSLGLSRGLNATFNGLPAAGTWTLKIRDHAGADVGSFASWTLRLTQGTPASCGGPSGVCCRGATCSTTETSAAACSSSLISGQAAGASFPTGAACNTGGSTTTPCCYADYNKVGGITVNDIFDFLNDWFAGSPYANFGGNGSGGVLAVQNIFDFLNAWFSGGC